MNSILIIKPKIFFRQKKKIQGVLKISVLTSKSDL